jgi:formate-dependent phosphoribosylglycinamide formyltransferase (GAR transformylase)
MIATGAIKRITLKGKRRMGVAIARAKTIDNARAKAKAAADAVEVCS